MSQDVMIFWLIHLVIGVVVPVLSLTGCCRREEEAQAAHKNTRQPQTPPQQAPQNQYQT